MKVPQLTLLALVLVIAFSASQCRNDVKNSSASLEELPKDIAANLKKIPHSELLVSFPAVTVAAPPPATGPLPLPKSCSTTQPFTSYVTFPVTICSRDPGLGGVLTQYLQMTGPSDVASISSGVLQAKTFKLSFFQRANLSPLLVCHLRGGPWTETMVKETDCNNVTKCTMAVHCPGCPVFVWFGATCESTGRPTEVNFFEPLTEGVPSSSRCPGSLSDCGSGDGDPNPSPIVP